MPPPPLPALVQFFSSKRDYSYINQKLENGGETEKARVRLIETSQKRGCQSPPLAYENHLNLVVIVQKFRQPEAGSSANGSDLVILSPQRPSPESC